MNSKDPQAILSELDRQLESRRLIFEAEGVQITGISGGSKEGPIWQFQFRKTWALPPDQATAAVHISWAEWPEGDEVRITRQADIYQPGQHSSFKDKQERSVSLSQCMKEGVWPMVEAGIEEARVLLEQALCKRSNPASLPPLII